MIARLLGNLVTVGLAVLLASCEMIKPPLRVMHEKDGVVVDVQSLGEYPTNVTRIRITDTATGRTVWEVVPGSSGLQFNTILLRAGANKTDQPEFFRGTVKVITPNGATFTLEPQKRYEVMVWGSGTARVPARAEFTL